LDQALLSFSDSIFCKSSCSFWQYTYLPPKATNCSAKSSSGDEPLFSKACCGFHLSASGNGIGSAFALKALRILPNICSFDRELLFADMILKVYKHSEDKEL
jgi:hypothetical protein